LLERAQQTEECSPSLSLAIKQACLRALSELDQLETDWIGCIKTCEPQAVAGACRLLGHRMESTMSMVESTGVIKQAETAVESTVDQYEHAEQ